MAMPGMPKAAIFASSVVDTPRGELHPVLPATIGWRSMSSTFAAVRPSGPASSCATAGLSASGISGGSAVTVYVSRVIARGCPFEP